MARTQKHKAKRSKPKEAKTKSFPFHAFWSGAVSFGLVNVPVYLFPATRRSGVRLRMINSGGVTLERRYYCPRDDKVLVSDEIVRGYELESGSYVIVTDQELEAAEPVKTREIELRQFVQLTEVAPAFMERGYYLTPGKGAVKAYHLLAEAMEKTGRAGIATFVMRDREYLVAIFAQNGILCAETLRFQDEVRTPEIIGLPEPVEPSRQRVSSFEQSISALATSALPRDKLVDVDAERLKALIARKKKRGKDVIAMNQPSTDGESTDEDDVDLLDAIRRSLRMTGKGAAQNRTRAAPSRKASNGKHAVHRQAEAATSKKVHARQTGN